MAYFDYYGGVEPNNFSLSANNKMIHMSECLPIFRFRPTLTQVHSPVQTGIMKHASCTDIKRNKGSLFSCFEKRMRVSQNRSVKKYCVNPVLTPSYFSAVYTVDLQPVHYPLSVNSGMSYSYHRRLHDKTRVYSKPLRYAYRTLAPVHALHYLVN